MQNPCLKMPGVKNILVQSILDCSGSDVNREMVLITNNQKFTGEMAFTYDKYVADHGKMSIADPAFRVIPKNSTCFLVWRIEKMQLIPVPKDHYGSFYTGDSYIILSSAESGDSGGIHVKVKEAKSSLDIHIHFWLGNHTSQDEAGVAAYKTVELDDYLGGFPVQHREVQGHESRRFIAYFKDGIRLLEGGVASGFNHVVDTFAPRMFLIKGKRRPLISQLPNISWEHMNDGDVFVVDTKQVVIVWNGTFANHMEKIQGAKVAQKIKSEHGGGNILIVDDGEETKMPSVEKEYFNKFLPIHTKKVTSYKNAKPDDTVERRQSRELKLYRCSDEGGTLKVTEVKNGPLEQKDLMSQDSFIVDNGEAGIWVWVGKKASQKERMEAMRNAQGFIKKKGYANHTQVTRVIDGGEPMEFKALFQNWRDRYQTQGLGKVNKGNVAKTVQTRFDAATLHEHAHLAATTQIVDDGSGKREVWRVENFELVPVDPKEQGRFFGGDCYVVKYTYHNGTTENSIIYYWLGHKSTTDERGTAALKTIELDNAIGGLAVQARVVQGKEPPHFMTMFNGKMVIFEGGKASGFNNVDGKDKGPGDTYLLQVHGTSSMNTKAIQVELRAASLNSNDVFVLMGNNNVFIWAGKGSTGDEREMAKLVASASKREAIMVYEGQEKEDFWTAIGGKEPYSNDKRLQEADNKHPSRLFQCSNASGNFTVVEIIDFDQSDLVEDDVMLLDAWDTIFIWSGQHSNEEERKLAERTSQEYLRTDPSNRDIHTPVFRIKQGLEPPNFTGFFGVWDRSLWSNNKTYEQMKQELADDNPGITLVDSSQVNGTVVVPEIPVYPLSVLLEKDPAKLPQGINLTAKESHLSEEEFEQLFEMKRSDYISLPQWKQVTLRKKTGLF